MRLTTEGVHSTVFAVCLERHLIQQNHPPNFDVGLRIYKDLIENIIFGLFAYNILLIKLVRQVKKRELRTTLWYLHRQLPIIWGGIDFALRSWVFENIDWQEGGSMKHISIRSLTTVGVVDSWNIQHRFQNMTFEFKAWNIRIKLSSINFAENIQPISTLEGDIEIQYWTHCSECDNKFAAIAAPTQRCYEAILLSPETPVPSGIGRTK